MGSGSPSWRGRLWIGVNRFAIGIEQDRPTGTSSSSAASAALLQGKTHRLRRGLGHRRYTKSLGGIA